MTLSDNLGTSFDLHTVEEYTAAELPNGCYWEGSPFLPTTRVQGSSWQVGAKGHNQWGYDTIGYILSDVDTIITQGPKQNPPLQLPCTVPFAQDMGYECNSGLMWVYETVPLKQVIQPSQVQVCRTSDPNACQTKDLE